MPKTSMNLPRVQTTRPASSHFKFILWKLKLTVNTLQLFSDSYTMEAKKSPHARRLYLPQISDRQDVQQSDLFLFPRQTGYQVTWPP